MPIVQLMDQATSCKEWARAAAQRAAQARDHAVRARCRARELRILTDHCLAELRPRRDPTF